MKKKDTSPEFTVGGRPAVFTLVVVTMLYVVNYMDRMVLSATLPLIKADLMLSDAQCGWLGTIYFIVVALLTIPAAILCDRWSRKKSLAIMAVLWSGATFLTGLSGRFLPLFAARGGVGVGEAGFTPGGIAYISGSFREESRARVTGVFNLGQPLGSIIGIVIAGVAAQANLWGMGWRSPFFLFAVPGVLLGILVLFTRDYPTTPITAADSGEKNMGVGRGLLIILKTPTLLFTSLGVGALSFVGGAVGYWLPTYFVRTRSIDVAKASYLMGGIILIACVGPILGGILADGWKKKRTNARPLTAALFALFLGVFLYFGFSRRFGRDTLGLLPDFRYLGRAHVRLHGARLRRNPGPGAPVHAQHQYGVAGPDHLRDAGGVFAGRGGVALRHAGRGRRAEPDGGLHVRPAGGVSRGAFLLPGGALPRPGRGKGVGGYRSGRGITGRGRRQPCHKGLETAALPV